MSRTKTFKTIQLEHEKAIRKQRREQKRLDREARRAERKERKRRHIVAQNGHIEPPKQNGYVSIDEARRVDAMMFCSVCRQAKRESEMEKPGICLSCAMSGEEPLDPADTDEVESLHG